MLVILGVVVVIFLLFNVLPADPARMMLDKREDSEQLNEIKKKYALDQPVFIQFLYYINDLSFISVPNTVVLATSSMLLASFLGIILGILCAIFINTFFDRLIIFFTAIGISLPSFFSAMLFAWIFGFLLHDYTNLSVTGSLFEIDDYSGEKKLSLINLILPALTLSLRPLSIITQLTRNSLIEVLSMDYIRTATSKGLSKFKVLFKHALVNALNPVITSISGWFASLLAGSVFVEYIFGWNGIGKELVNSLNNLDVPVVMGIVLLVSLIFVFVNIVVDYLYSIIDPRIKT